MKSTYTRANPPLARILLGGCALGVSIGSNAADLSAQILDGRGRSLAGVDAKLYELVSVAHGKVKETKLGVARSGIDGKVTIRYADPHARGATSQHLDEILPALLAADRVDNILRKPLALFRCDRPHRTNNAGRKRYLERIWQSRNL